MKEKEKSLKKNAIYNVIKTIMSLVFPLITFPYASRILLPDGIGKVNFANSIISYFAIIASLGIETYGIREASKVRNDRQKLTKLSKELFFINLISTLFAYLLFIISLFVVPKFLDYKILLCVCSSSLLLSTLGVNWLYSALEEYKYIAIRSILSQLVSLCLLFIFVKTKDDYIKYATIGIISSGGANIFNFIHSRKFIDFKLTFKYNLLIHIKPILIFFASSIAISIFTILDTSMLGFLSTDTQVGYYSAASKIVRMVRDIFPACFTVLFARLSFYTSNNERQKIIDLSEKTLNFIFCFSIPIICGIFLLCKPLIILLCGKYYLPAIHTTMIMTPLIFFSSCSGFLGGELLIANGKEKKYLYCVIFASLIDVALNFLFIPVHGAYGAALATLITEILIFIIYIILTWEYLRQIKLLKPFFQYVIAASIMSIAVYFISKLFSSCLLQLIIPTICGILIYGLILFILKNNFFKSLLQLVLNHRKENN
jgi:O-antigen/teichoic acid export membrane protein